MQLHCRCIRGRGAAARRALLPLCVVLGSVCAALPLYAQAPPAQQAPDAPPPDAPATEPAEPVLVPPRVLHSVPPTYPASHQTHGEHPTVVLKLTILADGSIADAAVEHSAGDDFDQAAISAVKQWTFEPARRGGEAIASRVGVAVHFELPELGVVDVVSVQEASPMVPHPHAEPAPEHRVVSDDSAFGARAEVEAELHAEQRSASDYRIDGAALHAAPRTDGADLLRSAPGMVVARIEGDAVGHRLMLRGFDADHGQDIELKADGVPINQPSHIHGQGYADLGFIIPETVRSLRVVEGVYDPEQGDFAVAGSAEFELGVEQRGIKLATSYGAFDTFRELALWAPEQRRKDTFAAVTFRKTSGFGQNRAATSGAAVAQGSFGSNRLKLLLHGSAYGARAATAGVLRRDDIEAGRVGFYDVYPYPTAQNQNGFAARAQLSAKLRYLGAAGDQGELTLFFVFNDFRLLANYTGFTEVSRTNPDWAGRGDLIEQLNTTRTLGTRARYRTAVYKPASWFEGTLELGLAPRVDLIAQGQNLLEAPDNTTWDKRVDASITGVDIGGYLDADLGFTRFVRLKGGVRADLLSYRVEDRLQNFIPAIRAENYIPGYRRSAAGIAAGPRAVLEVTPITPLTLSVAYGEGFRSPQALLLDEGETAPFTKVRSADLGARVALGAHEELRLRGSGYFTRLTNDVVFDPREGRAEPVGPSQRLGVALHADLRPVHWLIASASATYVHATLEKPPAPTVEDPSPPFESGQLLPYVPPWVLRADLGAEHALFETGGAAVTGRAGAGFTYWSPRPLPYGERSEQVALLDASVGARWRMLSLDCSLLNLLDTEYAALELSYPSSWNPDQPPSRLPARTIMAGAPRTWLLTLGVTL
jgi:iron complex outermembrane recepter protein